MPIQLSTWSCLQIIEHDGHNIKINNRSFEWAVQLKYLGTALLNRNSIHEEIKRRLKSGNARYHLVQNLVSSNLLSKNIKI